MDTGMASSDVREELDCAICLHIYTDPITLRCGHNFCRACIERVLDSQRSSGVYMCPECREGFQERPTLRKNTALSNIAQHFHSQEPKQGEARIWCTNCIHASVTAVKSCLLCECSLCDSHLKVHSKSPEHVLIEPTKSFTNRKCPVHKKILEYYCTEDATFICVSCRLDGNHKKHKVCLMKEMADKVKEKIKGVRDKVLTKQDKVGKKMETLKAQIRKAKDKADGETRIVTALLQDIKRELVELEKKVLSEISRRLEQASLSASRQVKKLEIEQEELSTKGQQIEKLLKATDPFTVLQEGRSLKEPSLEEDKMEEKDMKQEDKIDHHEPDKVSRTLYGALSDFISYIKRRLPPRPEAMEVLLDMNTACEDIDISGDLKTISRSEAKQYHPQRFQYFPQVLSTSCFSSGQHAWEVETSDIGNWRIGASYPTIERNGDRSYFGDNDQSWCLRRYNNSQYSVIHDGKEVSLTGKVSSHRLRVCLDYERGKVTFYELCHPIRHLHTFTTNFTQPLHAAFCVWDDWVKISM